MGVFIDNFPDMVLQNPFAVAKTHTALAIPNMHSSLSEGELHKTAWLKSSHILLPCQSLTEMGSTFSELHHFMPDQDSSEYASSYPLKLNSW